MREIVERAYFFSSDTVNRSRGGFLRSRERESKKMCKKSTNERSSWMQIFFEGICAILSSDTIHASGTSELSQHHKSSTVILTKTCQSSTMPKHFKRHEENFVRKRKEKRKQTAKRTRRSARCRKGVDRRRLIQLSLRLQVKQLEISSAPPSIQSFIQSDRTMSKLNYLIVLIIASHVLIANCGILGKFWRRSIQNGEERKTRRRSVSFVTIH